MGKDLKGKEMGSGLSQRIDGVYCARFVNRFGKRVSLYSSSRSEIKDMLQTAIYEDKMKINVQDNSTTLNEWYVRWLNIHKDGLLKPSTRNMYNQVFDLHISPNLGKYKLQGFTTTQIKEFIISLKDEKSLDFATQNRARIMLQDMFDKALNDELVRRNPVKGIKLVRRMKEIGEDEIGDDVKVLTVDEQQEFFDCCKGTFYDNLFTVMVSTGLRIGEVAALTWKDIDIKKKEITVTKTLLYQKFDELGDTKKTFHLGTPKTKTSIRKVPINRQCEVVLKKQWMQKQVVSKKRPKAVPKEFKDLLFTTKFNTPLNVQIVSDSIRAVINEINLTRDTLEEMEYFSSHTFRHSFATRCFEAGIKPKIIQSYLGHATLQMTMDLYASSLKYHKDSEMELLENILDATMTTSDGKIEQRYIKASNGVENDKGNVIKFNGVKMA